MLRGFRPASLQLKTNKNLDFVPGQSQLTLSNIRDKTAFVKGSEISVSDVNAVKEYSCMQAIRPACNQTCVAQSVAPRPVPPRAVSPISPHQP